MRVVIHLERAGFQRFTHTCRDEFVGFFLHLLAFLRQADNLLALVLLALLTADDTEFLHALKQWGYGIRL